MTTKVIVNGAAGKMGRITVATIEQQPDLTLVASLGADDHLAQIIQDTKADVVVDFTTPHVVFANSKTILLQGARPVIGTTGLTAAQIQQLQQLSREQQLGGIIAPNFSLAALLMMRFAQQAAHYLPDVEIIEMHHEQKIDAPSGTAIKTAELIEQAREHTTTLNANADQPARGDNKHGVTTHSVRLPGLFAHQCVLFGNQGELLTIRHDAMSREAMMPGVVLACHAAMQLNELVYGLEHVLK